MKNKRISLVWAALLLAATNMNAGNFKFGVEWGANAMLLKAFSYNIIDDAGSRLSEKSVGAAYHPNGTFLVSAGLETGEKCIVSINSGFSGITDGRRVIPVTLRGSLYPAGIRQDGIMYFLDGGVDFDPSGISTMGLLGSVGTGYHIVLSNKTSLNLMLHARLAVDHPKVANPDGGGYVSTENTLHSNAEYVSAGISVSLQF